MLWVEKYTPWMYGGHMVQIKWQSVSIKTIINPQELRILEKLFLMREMVTHLHNFLPSYVDLPYSFSRCFHFHHIFVLQMYGFKKILGRSK